MQRLSHPAGLLPASDFFHQPRFVGELAGLFFGIDQTAVDHDLKHPAARLDQPDLRSRRPSDPVRQTGGSLAIASLVAVFDGDPHNDLPKGIKSACRLNNSISQREYASGFQPDYSHST